MPVPLSILDLAFVGRGETPHDALHASVALAQRAEARGYTPQYEGLQALWSTYTARGLVVVGTPCNRFAGQEPGKPEEIASFCKLNRVVRPSPAPTQRRAGPWM